ncbi:hypothetical protein NV64_05895 [Erwinia sp. B116]|nr:hypothetical protein NV64_05895 [Erwinia sp. B116]
MVKYGSIVLLFLLPLTLFTPNLGGTGLQLPMNILTVFVLSTLLLFAFLKRLRSHHLTLTPGGMLLLLATLLALLPLPFTDAQFADKASLRMAAVATAVLCYFALLQLPLTAPRHLQRLLSGVLLLIAAEAFIVLLQLFLPQLSWVPPTDGRPGGIFQQVNVLGSAIATGLGLALLLTILPGFRLLSPRRERWRQAALMLLLLLFPALLVWLQSRAAWIGGAGVTLLLFTLCGHYDRQRSRLAVALITVGTVAALCLLQSGEMTLSVIDHQGSNHARRTMLIDTLRMIAQHPLGGWGYGSFEYAFQHFRVTQPIPTRVTEIAEHPHNEVLLWWVEGGICGLAAMLILLFAGVRLLARARRADRRRSARGDRRAGQATALCLSLLPLLIHTQLEWPFYMSTVHALLFLLLLAVAERASGEAWRWRPVHRRVVPLFRNGIRLLAALLVLVTGLIWRGNQQLTAVELSGFQHPAALQQLSPAERWLNQDRWQYDRHVALLLAFNDSRDPRLLEEYRRWASGYLRYRVDHNVYASLILVLQYQGKQQEAGRYRQMAHLLYPKDARFF